jgi:HEAT repeat protein
MKAIFAYLWQHRWCKILLAGVVVCALLLSHPYIRQSIFGPTMNGTPWCVWEQTVRHAADRDEGRSTWIGGILKLLRIRGQPLEEVPDASPTFLPLYISLVTDSNVKVRRYALARLVGNQEPEVTSVFKRALADDDPECRLSAARGAWLASKDPESKIVLLELANSDMELEIRKDAVRLLGELSADSPDIFEAMAKLAKDPNRVIRAEAIESMPHFGKRCIPIVQTAIRDPEVRISGIVAAWGMGENGVDLIPDLLKCQDDPDSHVRRHVANSLHRIDPKQFPKPVAPAD